MKNKNTLTNTIIGVFATVLLVGAAFAFAPGILDVSGTVNIASPDYLVWSNVQPGGGNLMIPTDPTLGSTHSSEPPTLPPPEPTDPPHPPDPTDPPHPTGPEPTGPGLGPLPNSLEIGGASHSAEIVAAGGRTNQRIEWNINFYSAASPEITATVTNESARNSAVITNVNIGWDNENFANDRLSFDYTDSFVGTILAPGESTSVTFSVAWDGTVPAGFEGLSELVNTFFIEFNYELAP